MSKMASMRPSSTGTAVLPAAGVTASSCGTRVRKVQASALSARLLARSVTAAETSTVYCDPGTNPASGVTVTVREVLSYSALVATRMLPRRSEKLARITVAASRGSEKPIRTAPSEPAATSTSSAAGTREMTDGRTASTVKASSESKGARTFSLKSAAPRTEIVAFPEAVPAATANSPFHVLPVNCRAENSKTSPLIVAVTTGRTAGSTPAWASLISRARLTV